MTCPDCGARNTPQAPWCTQCLRPLGEDPAPSSPAAPAESASAPARPTPEVSTDAASTSATETDRPFRTVDGEVEWRCPACANWNLLAIPSCAVCGHALGTSGGSGERLADRIARARRPLWVVAVIGAVAMIGSIVLLVMTLSGGVGS